LALLPTQTKNDCRLAFTEIGCDRTHRYLEVFSPITIPALRATRVDPMNVLSRNVSYD